MLASSSSVLMLWMTEEMEEWNGKSSYLGPDPRLALVDDELDIMLAR